MRPDIAILYMSGYTDDAVIRRGVLEEGMAFIQKPFGADDLVRRVREVLDSGQRPTRWLHEAARVKPRILIVDDDENVRSMLTRMLGRNGYECESAGNGA